MIDEDRLRGELDAATAWLPVLDRGDAAWAAEKIIELVIDRLRDDPSIPRRTYDAWGLYFANTSNDVADRLTELISGHVSYDDLVNQLVDHFARTEGDIVIAINKRLAEGSAERD
jgi:hypothetical protein